MARCSACEQRRKALALAAKKVGNAVSRVLTKPKPKPKGATK